MKEIVLFLLLVSNMTLLGHKLILLYLFPPKPQPEQPISLLGHKLIKVVQQPPAAQPTDVIQTIHQAS